MKTKPPSSTESTSPETDSPPSRWKTLWASQGSNIRVLAIALVVALTVRLVIAEPRYIPSNSMDPTLHIGDRLIVDKISYRWQSPHRGDIIVFRPPSQLTKLGYGNGQAFIKRVIGEPGQTIQVTHGQVLVNRNPLTEPYLLEPPSYEMGAVTIPPGYVFVMGDNRNDSNDSHIWGVLPQTNIIGRAWLRFWPLDRLGPVG
ncbi:signal peptidase I [Nodosilinea sp. P-1105]|uniref:signal peptidase I n=1 Tax=Nodosilinea sp. P-1105 TaxID=2546229 RepID=UPI00146CE22F|nr:signal peptidase I [Nodosilinea sp. P-1105]NMF83569.1 signal peptidase I [Nodosilinea sp. P-1105]